MEKEETLLRKRLIELSNNAYQRGIIMYSDFLNLNELNILHTTPKDSFPVPYRKRGRTAGTALLKFRVCHSAPVLCRQCRAGTGTGCFVYYVRSGTDAGPGDHQRRIIYGKQTYQRTV